MTDQQENLPDPFQFWQNYKEKVSQAPKVNEHEVDIQDAIGLIAREDFTNLMQLNADTFRTEMQKGNGSNEEKFYSYLRQLHSLYLLGLEFKTDERLHPYRSFNSYLFHFFNSDKTQSEYTFEEVQMGENIQRYIRHSFGMKRELNHYELNYTRAKVNEGKWILLPNYNFWDSYNFTHTTIIEETISLLKSGYDSRLFMHASGSSALATIAQHGILSAREARERNIFIGTGEYTTYTNKDNSSGWHKRHNTVFASMSRAPSESYTFFKWFDEYPVIFGIGFNEQIQYVESLQIFYEDDIFDPETMTFYRGQKQLRVRPGMESPDEALLGSYVPLKNIIYVYGPKLAEDRIKNWLVEFNLNHIKFVSIEAAELAVDYRIKTIMENSGLSELEILEGLLAFNT